MDFTLDDTQRTIASVARQTLARESAESGEPAWKALGRADLLSLALPERLGGAGFGVLEIAVLLTEVGRCAVPMPALHTLALGVLPIVRLGTRRQQDELLHDVAGGDRLLTAALREPPGTGTVADGARLTGVKVGVGYAASAYRILVSVDTRVFLVDPGAPGVGLTRTPTASGAPEFTVRLDSVLAEPLGGLDSGTDGDTDDDTDGGLDDDTDGGLDGDTDAARTLHRFALAGSCALGDGLLARALELTALHVRTREQFGRPLATFQAVAQQISDIYIASRTLHLVTSSACWRLGAGLDADAELDLAGYWLAEEAPAALRMCHHLHGGLGVDVSYPLHRCYSAVKDLVRSLGGVAERLDLLGVGVAS